MNTWMKFHGADIMKLKGLILMLAITLTLFGFCSCGDKNAEEGTTENSAENTTVLITYEQISQDEAKRIMDTEEGYVIIDARTEEEFSEGHIENAILIPEYEIANRAEQEIPDKEALILVYCRSGRRSKIASDELIKLGYSNVKEFGGIIDSLFGFRRLDILRLELCNLTENKLLKLVYVNIAYVLYLLAVSLKQLLFEIQHGGAYVPELFLFLGDLSFEILDNCVAALFDGFGNNVGTLVGIAYYFLAHFLCGNESIAYRFLFVPYFIKVGDHDTKLSVKLDILAVYLGVFVYEKIDIIVYLGHVIALKTFAEGFVF